MQMLGWLLGVFVILPTTVWMALVVHYRVNSWWARAGISLLPMIVIGAAFWLLPFAPWALAVWLGLFVVTLAWWLSLHPQADRDWAPGMTIMPRVEMDGDCFRIREFRNFDYDTAGKPVPRYEERTFDLRKLRSLDYFLSHWSGPVMAHTLVSVGFDDGHFLAVSVEARRRAWQRYSPLWGLFRSYELMIVLGDERDIVRLRTNVRRERVYMYRVHLPPEHLRRLVLDYLQRAESLAARPRWYNSVTSNCTTNLFYARHRQVPLWLKPGIFLNGLSARVLYRLGVLAKDLPFKELQARSAIREPALAAGNAADFSQRIRANLVEP
nr:putative membrane protein [uncultured bacterium]